MKLLVLGSFAIAAVFGGRNCGTGEVTKGSKFVVFGDSLSDGGDGQFFKWKTDMNGLGAQIKEQQEEKFDAWVAGFSALGYNGLRHTDKLIWVEYLARMFHKSGCRIPKPLNLATASATAFGEAINEGWTTVYGGDDSPIQVPQLSSVVDRYLSRKKSSPDDVIFFNIGGNDVNNGVYYGSIEAAKIGAYYTAAATYFASQSQPIVADAVAAVMAAATQTGETVDEAEATTYVSEISSLMQAEMAAGSTTEQVELAVADFITAKATLAVVSMANAAVEQGVRAIMSEVNKLAMRGFGKIIVFAPPPLHLTPAAQMSGSADLVKSLIDGFRSALGEQVQNLNSLSEIPSPVRFLDFTEKLSAEILESDAYAEELPPTEHMCFYTVGDSGLKPRQFSLEEGCRCDDYAWVDQLHPTGRIHHKLARWVFDAITTKAV